MFVVASVELIYQLIQTLSGVDHRQERLATLMKMTGLFVHIFLPVFRRHRHGKSSAGLNEAMLR